VEEGGAAMFNGKGFGSEETGEMVCEKMQTLMEQLECLTSEEDKMDWEPTDMSVLPRGLN